MKKSIILFLILCLAACFGGEKESSKKTAHKESAAKSATGKVVVLMDGEAYRSEVSCLYYNEDHFTFLSDKKQMEDTNNDGLIINGFQTGKKIDISLNINGHYYSGGNFTIIKEGNIAKGSGRLFDEDSADSFQSHFEVTCN